MWKLLQYYGKYQGFRGSLGGMPGWARLVLFLVALPGIAAIALSILALLVSILALLVLCVPVFRVINWITGGQAEKESEFEVDLSGGAGEFIDPVEVLPQSSEVSGDGDPFESLHDDPEGSTQVTVSPVRDRPRRQVEVKIIE